MTAHFTVESHWDTNAEDGCTPLSVGIPQIQARTAQMIIDRWGHKIVVTEAYLKSHAGLAIRLACAHFRDLLRACDGDYVKATRSYNAGLNNVRMSKRLPGMPHFHRVLEAYEKYRLN